MKAFSDFIAIILFFATYTLTKNMVTATIVAVIVGILQAAYTLTKHKKMPMTQWLGLVLIIVFGGLTIFLQDPVFIMLKTTILLWFIAAAMLVAQWLNKNSIRLLLGNEIQLPEKIWNKLGYAWIIFLFSLGLLNFIIAYPFTPEREQIWINFKFYGYLPIILIFSLAQGIYLMRHLPKEKS